MRPRRLVLFACPVPVHPAISGLHARASSALPFVSFQSLSPRASRGTNCPRFATHFEPLSFQPITNCPIDKSFVLILIQHAGGVGAVTLLLPWNGPACFPSIPFVFRRLRTLLRDGRHPTLLESIRCVLFPSSRGCVYPLLPILEPAAQPF